jgi:hypothetical protein
MDTMYFSNGLQALGLNQVCVYFKTAITYYPNLSIISIGTGNCYFEHVLEIIFNVKISCIEPFPNIFNPINTIYKHPDYANTQDLYKNSPHVVGNCFLILNWCDPAYSEYDYESIMLLKPKIILWIGEIHMGCAGGFKFHDWLKTNTEYTIVDSYKKRNDFDPINQKKHGLLIYTTILMIKK